MCVTRFGLWILPFRSLQKLQQKLVVSSPASTAHYGATTQQVVWAVDAVSRLMPNVKCLARALITQVLLSWYGQSSELCIGVSKNDAGQLDAHAWVEINDQVVIGKLPDLARYQRLPSLS